MHTYKHTYKHTYIHTYIHTYTNTHIHKHTYIHTYTHTYIHKNIHTHTYKAVGRQVKQILSLLTDKKVLKAAKLDDAHAAQFLTKALSEVAYVCVYFFLHPTHTYIHEKKY